MPTLRLAITGRVQGVYFRASTKAEADRLGLFGFAKNESDGSVSVLAVGPRENLEILQAWCEHGPELARVDRCEGTWDEADEPFLDFSIR